MARLHLQCAATARHVQAWLWTCQPVAAALAVAAAQLAMAPALPGAAAAAVAAEAAAAAVLARPVAAVRVAPQPTAAAVEAAAQAVSSGCQARRVTVAAAAVEGAQAAMVAYAPIWRQPDLCAARGWDALMAPVMSLQPGFPAPHLPRARACLLQMHRQPQLAACSCSHTQHQCSMCAVTRCIMLPAMALLLLLLLKDMSVVSAAPTMMMTSRAQHLAMSHESLLPALQQQQQQCHAAVSCRLQQQLPLLAAHSRG